ncbi:amidase signature enzyme [Viridothelium virens]|uniref:Glutamyl-tRNA(Gln) amidotransferase subunit A, mitochondrial n=1 Tax=Viridothelium virens TaxID=1048519 RepID=A0A6A6H335_VIRVR|nr:amidase signature enzyme [Viridothelium virens]
MSSLRHVQRCLANAQAHHGLNAFISLADRSFLEAAAQKVDSIREPGGPLNGKLIAVKDNICTSDFPTTAASYILKNFNSSYDATVVRRLRESGAIITGKTNLDEFGMGSHSTFSHFGSVKNPHNHHAQQPPSAGGSSGGSAVAVATSQCWASLGTDTGGSVRLPAAYTGTIGFKPSYGLLSRHGVLAYANSLDTVGILARTVSTTRSVFAALNAHDPKDPTSLPPSTRSRIAATTTTTASSSSSAQSPRSLRIGIPTHYNPTELSPSIRTTWHATLARLHALGHTLHAVSLPSTPAALAAYYVLAPAEASSNLAKYDGVRYGTRAAGPDARGGAPGAEGQRGAEAEVLYARTRGEGFGPEVKRRIVLGAYGLSKGARGNYFLQAQRVRRRVQEEFDTVFRVGNPLRMGVGPGELHGGLQTAGQGKDGREGEGVDVLVCPTAPGLPPALDTLRERNPVDAYTNDVFTVPASLVGLPAVSVPVPNADNSSAEGEAFPFVGMQIIGQFGSDDLVLDVAQALEEQIVNDRA